MSNFVGKHLNFFANFHVFINTDLIVCILNHWVK